MEVEETHLFLSMSTEHQSSTDFFIYAKQTKRNTIGQK